jgi:hypothetical protein
LAGSVFYSMRRGGGCDGLPSLRCQSVSSLVTQEAIMTGTGGIGRLVREPDKALTSTQT